MLEAGIELPDFEFKRYGEVIDHYIASVRRAVSRMDGWEVNNNVALGFFSFTKFVMYNDLNPEAWEDNVDLTKNELIQAIFNPAKMTRKHLRKKISTHNSNIGTCTRCLMPIHHRLLPFRM